MKNFIIFTDGASRGNPGHSSCGFIIKSLDGVIWVQDSLYLGIGTNNIAEYTGVKLALKRLITDFHKLLPVEAEVRVDSQLVAKQLNGLYKIKNPNLKTIFLDIKQLEIKVGKVNYLHIPRTQNLLADKLANYALDNHLKNK